VSFSQRRVLDVASKECGGAEHVLSRVSYWQFCFLDHHKIFEKRKKNSPVRVKNN
jgi:hypothetical protein